MPAGIDIGGIISGFDQSRRSFRDAEIKQQQANQDREFSILEALAKHPDDRIAELGAIGMLELARSGPKSRKGMQGFLGEVDRSSYLPQIQALFERGAGALNAQPQPGSAVQPDSAAVDPERVAHGPQIGVGAPPVPAIGEGPPGMPLPGAEVDEGPPQMAGGRMGMAPPPMPEVPETPQQKYNRLYPSARQVADEQAYGTLAGRLRAVIESIKATQPGSREENAALGNIGTPRGNETTKPIEAEYTFLDDGSAGSGTVMIGNRGTATVGGRPVQVVKQLGAPSRTRQLRSTNYKMPDGTMQKLTFDYSTDPPVLVMSEDTWMPVSEPPAFGPVVTTPEGIIQPGRNPGDPGRRISDAPPRAGELDQNQTEATQWKTDVDTTMKGELSTYNAGRPGLPKSTALPAAKIDAIVKQITKGRYKTYGELTAGTKKQSRGPAGGGDSARERANRVRRRLEGTDPAIIQGPGIPRE